MIEQDIKIQKFQDSVFYHTLCIYIKQKKNTNKRQNCYILKYICGVCVRLIHLLFCHVYTIIGLLICIDFVKSSYISWMIDFE